jgi:hypothetical protein
MGGGGGIGRDSIATRRSREPRSLKNYCCHGSDDIGQVRMKIYHSENLMVKADKRTPHLIESNMVSENLEKEEKN